MPQRTKLDESERLESSAAPLMAEEHRPRRSSLIARAIAGEHRQKHDAAGDRDAQADRPLNRKVETGKGFIARPAEAQTRDE